MSMFEQRLDDPRTTWQRHGYIFFILFGVAMAAIGHLSIRALGMDSDRPANTFPLPTVLLFFAALVANVIVSYYASLAISDFLYRLRRKLFSDRRLP